MNQPTFKGKLLFSEALKAIVCPDLRWGGFEHLSPAWRAESCEGCKSDSPVCDQTSRLQWQAGFGLIQSSKIHLLVSSEI